MCKQVETVVSCEPAAVAWARHWASSELDAAYADLGGAGLEIQVVVSELVTNAVQANCSRLSLVLHEHHSYVQIAAEDDASGDPVKQDPEPNEMHGRGLLVVDALSTRWGVERENGTKTVWADIPLAGNLGPMFDCAR